MSQKNPITTTGKARLSEELRHLKYVELPQVIKDIATAREHGDLSENAEYQSAREKQSMIVERISTIEKTLANAEVIDPSKLSGSKAQFGATVKLLNDNDEEQIFQIVGLEEADSKQGLISIASPLARGLLGHEVGDQVEVHTSKGLSTFEILDLSYL